MNWNDYCYYIYLIYSIYLATNSLTSVTLLTPFRRIKFADGIGSSPLYNLILILRIYSFVFLRIKINLMIFHVCYYAIQCNLVYIRKPNAVPVIETQIEWIN